MRVRQRVSMWPYSRRNPGQWVSNELSWWTICHTCCHNSLLRQRVHFARFHGKRTLESQSPVSSALCPMSLLPLLILLCPFVVISHSQTRWWDAESYESSSESSILGVVLGTLNTAILSQFVLEHCPEIVLWQHRKAWERGVVGRQRCLLYWYWSKCEG